MTMTLGFDAYGYFEALFDFDKDVVEALFGALAKHAPGKRLRMAHYTRNGYRVSERDHAGKKTACADSAAIAAAIKKASYESWPNEDAPTSEPILLPGKGWAFEALRKERVFENENVAFHFEAAEIAKARKHFEAKCAPLFDLAEKQHLLLVFR